MSRPVKPEKMSWVVPYLTVADAGIAAHFYRDNFGFEVISTTADEAGKIFHAELKYKDIVIMCGNAGFPGDMTKTPAQGHFVSPVTLYLYHENVDALYNSLLTKEIAIEAAPEDQFWGDRTLRITDQDGHQWSFATHVAEHA